MTGLRRAAAVLALPTLVGCGASGEEGEPPEPPPVAVRAVEIAPVSVPVTVPAVGTFRSPQTTVVSTEVDGLVTALDVPEGQRVPAGHVLARLDDAAARAAVVTARADARNAEARLERTRRLHARGVVSFQELDDAAAAAEAARGRLQEAETRLAKTSIRAPFAGILGLRRAEVGDVLAPGNPIVPLTQVDPLEIVFSVPQERVAELAVDQPVRGVVGRCGARFTGHVRAVSPELDPATRSAAVRAIVPNTDTAMAPGMSAQLRVVVRTLPEAVVVPHEAVLREGTRDSVWVIGAEDRAERRAVELGEHFPDGVHVRRGLVAGERVVTAGQQRLRPGARVAVAPHEPVDNPILGLGWAGPLGACEP